MIRLGARAAAAVSAIGLCASLLIACAAATPPPAKLAAGPPEPAFAGTQPGLRLMSQSQYIHTIADVFGPDIVVNARFAPVQRSEGLVAVGAASAVVTSGAFDRLESVARLVAQQVTDERHRDVLIPCRPAVPAARDDACARRFLGQVGRLLYRRPMTERELALKVAVAGDAAAEAGGFYPGLAYALSGMLVSPNFLLIRDVAEPDPGRAGGWRLDGYSKAARLSFLLWDTTPDEALLTAAARGELGDDKGLRRQVERMLAAPQLEQGVRAFFEDFLVLEAFDNVAKDPVIYPAFTTTVAREAREQALRTAVDHLVTRRGDYRELFTTRRTMMSAGLAPIYRTRVDVAPGEWVPFAFAPEDPRAGLLTQVAFLSQYAHPGRSSPTRRGRGIREVLMCQKVPDPPPNVDFSIIEDPKAKFHTARERLTAHNVDPTCRGCHMLTDPIGLGLEQFDGAGQLRETEHGAPIDPAGSLDGVDYADAAGMGQALRDSPAVRGCIVRRIYGYGVGRPVARGEDPVLRHFEARLDAKGYRLEEILRTILYSKAFFAVSPGEERKSLASAE